MRISWALLGALPLVAAQSELNYSSEDYPDIPEYGPQPNPPYMVDNQNNYYEAAPDKGVQNGAVWLESGSFGGFMSQPAQRRIANSNVTVYNHTLLSADTNVTFSNISRMAFSQSPIEFVLKTTTLAYDTPALLSTDSSYWLPQLADAGRQPIAGSDYKFYRNVKDYGATGGGEEDDTEAINAAVEFGDRCGEKCGNTFAQGAIIYFPPGVYKICRPIIQLYYTQFIGDALNPPTIKGCDSFQGIALFDTDPYIPGGNGANWFINQNQFFRQIRNFRFDLREMPYSTDDNDQPLVPTGIHWQVSQACSLQNLYFEMPEGSSKDEKAVTHVGIFMENGSGGFVSDLTFKGGSIGWRAGSQQYTVINLKFQNCLTAVQMIWDWGFNWQRVEIDGGAVGFNISGVGGDDGQGVGSVSIIDSKITNCPIGILTHSGTNSPNIVIDNLEMSNVAATVKDSNGNVILGSSDKVDLWALGKRYKGYEGQTTSGAVEAPKKGERLLDSDGKLFYRSHPQYQDFGVGQFRVATDHGCTNNGTGDNTNEINKFLRDAQSAGEIAYFPAGIYRVGGTVFIPTGSRVVGASWSQIQGAGAYFSDIFNPKVVVQVGIKGDVGTMEISDMMFNVQGATAGAIVLEWNVHESSQGSAAMWDSHVRVGGATGSSLETETCPKFGFNDACICAALLFHVTPQASGYFENVWIWLADHDNDMVVSDSPDKLVNQISLYAARGTLIESEGPSWFYGTGSEHTILYQYQLYGAKDIYMGHIQTETPYFQPVPVAPLPFEAGKPFPGDPSFESCDSVGCEEAWGLRIINSERITLHSAGLYSFFQEYYQDCLDTFDCQKRLCEVKGSKGVVLFNMFTVATEEIGTGINGGSIKQSDGNQRGFTTEISVWIPLEGNDEFDVVYVGPDVYEDPSVTCPAPCLLVFPTSSLAEKTTITPGSYTTSLEYGNMDTTTVGGQVITTFITKTTIITIPIAPITTDGIQYSNINITRGQTSSALTVRPSVDIPPVPWVLPDGDGGSTTRTILLPPWPDVTRGPPDGTGWGNAPGDTAGTVSGIYRTPFVTTITATRATVITVVFPSQVSPISVQCPPNSEIVFNTPKTTITTDCPEATDWTFQFNCPATRVVTFIGSSTAVLTADCTLSTVFNHITEEPEFGTTATTQPPVTDPLPIWTTWPVGQIEAVDEEEDDDDEDGVVGFWTPCKLWFFNICLIKNGIRIRGIRWIFPPGIYGPGPVPPGIVRLPFPWTIPIPTPAITWPRITVGRDGKVTYPENEPTSCDKVTASFCSTTTIESITTIGPSESTITRTESSCGDKFTACGATDIEATTTKAPENCPLPTDNAKRGIVDDDPELVRRQTERRPAGCPANAVIYPKNPENVGDIPQLLSEYSGKYVQVQSSQLSFTAFFWVPYLDAQTMARVQQSGSVEQAYYYEDWNSAVGDFDLEDVYKPADDLLEERFGSPLEVLHPGSVVKDDLIDRSDSAANVTLVSRDENDDSTPTFEHMKRAPTTEQHRYTWHLSQDSMPPGRTWRAEGSDTADPIDNEFRFHYDNAGSTDQYVYIINEKGYWPGHAEFVNNNNIDTLESGINFGPNPIPQNPTSPNFKHGSGAAAMVVGNNLGICKGCKVRFVASANNIPGAMPVNLRWARIGERLLQQLTDTLDEIVTLNRQGKAVLSMSFGAEARWMPRPFFTTLYRLLNIIETQTNTLLVCSAGNNGNPAAGDFEGVSPARYPARFGDPSNLFGHLPNLVVVGATTHKTRKAPFSNYAPYLTTFAPGELVWLPSLTNIGEFTYAKDQGTSFSAPQVAGLAAYYRSLPSPWKTQLTSPARVKKLIRLFHRRFQVRQQVPDEEKKPVIWNGQVGDHSCLSDYSTRSTWDTERVCPEIDPTLDNQPDNGQTVEPCGVTTSGSGLLAARQDSGGSCPLFPDDGSDGGDGGGHTISFTSGAQPSPTCASGTGCGGVICSGFWCNPNPTGIPPDHQDPKDPNAGNPVPTRTISDPPGPSTTTDGGGETTSVPVPECDDKCKLDRGNPCNCGESGCDSQSPPCCANASCPNCDCGESGCSSSSPACCANGSCSWSWTGGGGGDGTGAPPQPPPDGRLIIIALQELSVSSSMSWDWFRSWVVFSAPNNGNVDMCFDSSVKSQSTTSVTGSNPGFPPGFSFDAASGVSCEYTGTANKVGSLTCARVSSIKCEAISPVAVDFCPPLNNPSMHGVVYCIW
ncbi:hypothetical protein VE03_09163 [Pseudogymnoascus sp. 23342-1-I1]|nr:hypothetical protein VE03_09163 [Pseudogymnoascus sp. 23342-1-I1]